jgi:hypothetical protein
MNGVGNVHTYHDLFHRLETRLHRSHIGKAMRTMEASGG